MTKWFAVAYPGNHYPAYIVGVNHAVKVIECQTQYEALALVKQWQSEHPERRYVIRREVEDKSIPIRE